MGTKVTPQRLGGQETPTKMSGHPSAEMVFLKVKDAFPNMSLDITNSMLLTFEQTCAVFIVENSSDAKSFDVSLEGHQHLSF